MTTLHVPAQLGISDAEAERLVESWSTSDSAVTTVIQLGFAPPQRPAMQPMQFSPGQQINLTSQQFETQTQLLELWQEYSGYHKALLENYIEELENKKRALRMAHVKAIRDWYRNNPGEKKPAEPEINESVEYSPVWQELHREQQHSKHVLNLITDASHAYSRQKGVLSRGLSAKQVAQGNR